MKIVFRVDASLKIGSGHVIRCLVLAKALTQRGYDIQFACTPLVGDMRKFISDSGFMVETLAPPKIKASLLNNTNYASWLQKTVAEDAFDFLNVVKSADLVITDHYAIGAEWQEIVTASLDCYLFALDDLGRQHKADLILDQTLGRSKSDYSISNARILTGSEFALLRPEFAMKHEAATFRKISKGMPRVLVSMGMIDIPNVTLKVLKALYSHVEAEFTVLLSKRSPHFKNVKLWCSSKPNVKHLEFVSDIAPLLLEHDIAIGAPGTSSWERACLGLPNIVIPIAKNQELISKQLVNSNATLSIDINKISSDLKRAFLEIIKNWDRFRDSNLVLCDGRGFRRVVLEIEHLINKICYDVSLRKATPNDIKLVYKWQVHPETRRYALNKGAPSWEEHYSWMSKKLLSTTDYFYMIVDRNDESRVGSVRLDMMHDCCYLVSIFIDPKNYGKGFALQALNIIDFFHPDVELHATVLKENTPSQALFKKACFNKVDEETFIRKRIN